MIADFDGFCAWMYVHRFHHKRGASKLAFGL